MRAPYPFPRKNSRGLEFTNISTEDPKEIHLPPWKRASSTKARKYQVQRENSANLDSPHQEMYEKSVASGRNSSLNQNSQLGYIKGSLIKKNADKARALSVIRTLNHKSQIDDYSRLGSNVSTERKRSSRRNSRKVSQFCNIKALPLPQGFKNSSYKPDLSMLMLPGNRKKAIKEDIMKIKSQEIESNLKLEIEEIKAIRSSQPGNLKIKPRRIRPLKERFVEFDVNTPQKSTSTKLSLLDESQGFDPEIFAETLEDCILSLKCNNPALKDQNGLKSLSEFKLSNTKKRSIEPLLHKRKEGIILVNNEYKVLNQKAAKIEHFWGRAILPHRIYHLKSIEKASFMKEVLRWDIFEEYFLAFFIKTMDFNYFQIRFSLVEFMKLLFKELVEYKVDKEEFSWPPETIYHPVQQEDHAEVYNGPVVTRTSWINFAATGGIRKILLTLAKSPISEEAKKKENKRFTRLDTVFRIDDGIYRYACGSIYKGQRKGILRDGAGTFSLCTGEASYEGEWEEGLMHGKGKLRIGTKKGASLENEGTFEGKWKNGLREGTGRVAWDDQSEFHGQFEINDMIFGTFTWFDYLGHLHRYLGLFKDYKMTHQGSLHPTQANLSPL
ncbi:unnamed protein product [Moneuplotes crassus]|uniref:Uncharacterized protein n=1 Tax=Euplotes crassus TaxID=5936 RepID=A0AAD1U2A7_EUPCR|nr:unnamed protein product [Moneuplotes crassus]